MADDGQSFDDGAACGACRRVDDRGREHAFAFAQCVGERAVGVRGGGDSTDPRVHRGVCGGRGGGACVRDAVTAEGE